MKVAVIGAGLAGSECSWILAEHYNLEVTLFEMKSKKTTPAQITPHLFAELVCSNSLKSKSRLNPAGTLKEEIHKLGSIVIPSARAAEVPAGETLAVDRELFSGAIPEKLKNHKNIT
ncbi:MAG: FAD-dependent oxidoreductase, partial [Silvanigrellaceae bacterium]|nr:FAD-dependent oxidoreductase [Silvanigrellaceae bacterium]